MSRPQRTGPYTLPLPPVPRRPPWMDGKGLPETSGLARRWQAVRCIRDMTPAQRRSDLAQRLSHETVSEQTDQPVRSGGMQSWDARAGRWRACPSLRAVRLAFHRAARGAS